MNDYSYSFNLADLLRHGFISIDEARAMSEYYLRYNTDPLVPAVPAPPVPLQVVMHGD